MAPPKTSELLAVHEQGSAELHKRFAEVFNRHRRLAFAHRSDQLFNEHWTPETAAAEYHFDSYENDGDQVTLVGVSHAGCFTYRISISFPLRLVDESDAIDAYLRQQYEVSRSKAG